MQLPHFFFLSPNHPKTISSLPASSQVWEEIVDSSKVVIVFFSTQ